MRAQLVVGHQLFGDNAGDSRFDAAVFVDLRQLSQLAARILLQRRGLDQDVGLFGVALFPNLVTALGDESRSLTVWNAASSEKTLEIMLVIAAVGMPFVIAYTAAIYWTFRGKVVLGEHSY